MKRTASSESCEEDSCCVYRPPKLAYGQRNRCANGPQIESSLCEAGCSSQATSASFDVQADLLNHWRTQEAKLQPSSLWELQHEVTPDRRCMLVTWLLDVAHEFKLSLETRLLSIDLMDRYLARTRLALADFQLLGISCLWVAAKYDEVRPPSTRHLCAVTNNLYSSSQMVDMERKVLSALGFEVACPTPLMFLDHFRTEVVVQSKAVDSLAHHLLEVATLASCPYYTPKAAPAPEASAPLLGKRTAAAKSLTPAPVEPEKPTLGRQASDLSASTAAHRTPECRAGSLVLASPPSRVSSCSSLTNAPDLSPFPTPEPGPELTSPPSSMSSLTGSPPASAEEAAPLAAFQPEAFHCCAGCRCLACSRPSFVAAAALNVALVVQKQQSPELMERISHMAQCPAKHLLQLSQALLQLHIASANTPGCATLLQRLQGRRHARARKPARQEASNAEVDSCR